MSQKQIADQYLQSLEEVIGVASLSKRICLQLNITTFSYDSNVTVELTLPL